MNEHRSYDADNDAQHEAEENMLADSPVFGDKPVGEKFRQADNADAHHGEHDSHNDEHDDKVVARVGEKYRHEPEDEQALKECQPYIFAVAVEKEGEGFLQICGY